MNILLDDIPYNNSLYPFAALRSLVHIRIGIITIFEKWQRFSGHKIFISSKTSDEANDIKFVKVPANIVPSATFLKQLAKSETLPAVNDCKTLNYPWQIFEYNDWALRQDFQLLTHEKISKDIFSTNQLVNSENIFVEEGADVKYSILNANDGPIYIGKNAEIFEGSLIRGPFALGEGSRIKMGAKIYGGTTIGPYCLASGEIKNSILMTYSNKAHDGYLGDSVIGSWCNIGAGSSNSNLKNTGGIVKMWSKEKNAFLNAGFKCGLLMGDYSRCAINTSFNTGTIVGISCNIFGDTQPAKYIDDFAWGNEKYIFEKAIADINNWKKMKGHQISAEEIEALRKIYQSN